MTMWTDPISRATACYTPAEAALYSAEQLRPGAAIEVPLSAEESLTVRLLPPAGQQSSWRGGELHATIDDEAVILSAVVGYQLGVTLTRLHHGSAPLALRLPGVALIVVGAALYASKPDAKSVTIHVGAPIP